MRFLIYAAFGVTVRAAMPDEKEYLINKHDGA